MPDRVFGRPGAGRIVLRGHEPMARVERRGHGRAEIDIAQAQHEVARAEDDLLHFLDGAEAVDAADELDIARAPGRVGVHAGHVFFDGEARGRVVPGERQMHDARGQFQIARVADLALGLLDQREEFRAAHAAAVVVDLQGANAGGEIDDAGNGAAFQPGHPGMDAEAQIEIEQERPALDEEIAVARRAADDSRRARRSTMASAGRHGVREEGERDGGELFDGFILRALQGHGLGSR